jgi:hypothetical protein
MFHARLFFDTTLKFASKQDAENYFIANYCGLQRQIININLIWYDFNVNPNKLAMYGYIDCFDFNLDLLKVKDINIYCIDKIEEINNITI